MSDIDTAKLLDALRQVGVDVPVAPPTTLSSSSPSIRRYWYISQGLFSTVVDWRDASCEAEAIEIARNDVLQAWYINDHITEAILVKEFSRNEYIDWLKRGVS